LTRLGPICRWPRLGFGLRFWPIAGRRLRLRTIDRWTRLRWRRTMSRWWRTMPRWRADRPRWWPVRNRAAVPAVALPVERPIAVVVVPVGGDHEAHDRNADLCSVAGQGHRLILILVLDVVPGHPATIAGDDHVAPFPPTGTTLDGNRRPLRNGVDERILCIGTGTHADIASDKAVRRMRDQGSSQQQPGGCRPDESFHEHDLRHLDGK